MCLKYIPSEPSPHQATPHSTSIYNQYCLKRKKGGTFDAPHGLRQMNGELQSGADWCPTA